MEFPYKSKYFTAKIVEEGIVLASFSWRENPLNNISDRVLDSLETLLDYAFAAERIVGLVLTGKGPVFSTGAYLPELIDKDMYGALHLSRKGTRIFDMLGNAPFVTCAAINGLCLGGGLELALACDLRIASQRARLGLTEATLGLVPGWGGTQRLVNSIGLQSAREMVFSGRQIRADEAKELGLVLSVHPHKELLPAAYDLLRPIVSRGRDPVNWAKKSLHLLEDTNFHTSLEVQSIFFGHAWDTPVARRLVEEFLAKQEAKSKGAKGKQGSEGKKGG